MNVVIIEDEHLSAERISSLLQQSDPGIRVLATLDSVSSAVQWFRRHEKPDLVIMDIQLADGLSFEIFNQVKVESPVIFTTAYQEYAIRAFKVNSVDYLLKPVTEEDLRSALSKYRNYFSGEKDYTPMGRELIENIRQMISRPYKSRFMVKVGDRIKSVDVKDILYFYSFQKGTYLHTAENRDYVIDFTLDALADLLDPDRFFRINRRYIISHESIKDMVTLSGTKLKVLLKHSDDQDVFVSRDRLPDFREWLDR
jgi:two-component system LytT family response regulator